MEPDPAEPVAPELERREVELVAVVDVGEDVERVQADLRVPGGTRRVVLMRLKKLVIATISTRDIAARPSSHPNGRSGRRSTNTAPTSPYGRT
jgi:hypothetical protein